MYSSIYFTQNAQTCNMPDYFTHAILADIIFERLEKDVRDRISDRKLYLLGAQGGDVFFMYNLNRSSNLGRRLHGLDAKFVFDNLASANISYAAGFATHYALDSTIHPAVYAFEAACKAPLAHLAFEKDIGLYVSRKYSTPRKIMPKEDVCGATFTVYDAVKKLDDSITLTGVERCLKRYFSYTRAVYARKKQTYKFDYDYSSLSPLIDQAADAGVKAATCVVRGDIDSQVFSKQFLQH